MYQVYIKNNHYRHDTFPNTAEGEEVFTITQERFDTAAKAHPDVLAEIEVSIDWDAENFNSHMATADALVTWDLPTENLAEVAPRLKWIHIICLLYTSPSPRDYAASRMPSSA